MGMINRMLMNVKSFTLIEVLVVAAIIGILIALMLPAIRGASDSAKIAVCMNNLRQMYLAIQMYGDDHDGQWTGGNFPPGQSMAGSTNIWMRDKKRGIGLLYNQYVDDLSVLCCPANNYKMWISAMKNNFGKIGSYCGTNYSSITYPTARLEDLKGELLVVDMYDTTGLYGPYVQTDIGPHRRKFNGLYGDGTVKLSVYH